MTLAAAIVAACVLGQPVPGPGLLPESDSILVRAKVHVENGRVPHADMLNSELDAMGASMVPLYAGEDLELASRVGTTGWYRVIIPWQRLESESATDIRDRWKLSYRGVFEHVDVEHPGGIASNDPQFPGQWGLRNVGKLPETLNDYDIDADAGWRLLSALKDDGYDLHPVRFALIDDGYGPNPIAPNWGHADMPPAVLGYNTVNGTTNTPAGCYLGHGTHVSSIAVALVDNGIGMAGVCIAPVTVDPIKVIDACWGVPSTCAEGILRGADRGATVANMSLQYSPPHSAYFRAAAAYAYERNVFMVAAAGNWSGQPEAAPATFKEVMGVIASTRTGLRAGFSNIGGDVTAPGAGIVGLVNTGEYAPWDGTSMAAPMVSGIALTMRSLNPDLSIEEVWEGITQTSRTWPLWTVHNGYGIPSLYRSVMWSIPSYSDFDRNGTIDVADMGAFFSAWSQRRERANCDGSLDDDDEPTFTTADLVCFQARFARRS